MNQDSEQERYSGYSPGTPPASPPPRQGRPWWFWLLAGCGGCSLVAFVVAAIFVFGAMRFLGDKMKEVGPVTMASMQQAMGEVPLYPGSTLEEQPTRMILAGLRTAEQLSKRKIARGVAVLDTGDTPKEVWQFYGTKLKALGWKPGEGASHRGGEQQSFRKGDEMVMLQVQSQNGRTVIVLMRGAPELAGHMPSSIPGKDAPQDGK
jgi:hypothetical protein